ncbi:MAG: AAA family ATPase [Chlamydiae bacterium]|nr:AAA family ATPase [Chlamydiota bacterium]
MSKSHPIIIGISGIAGAGKSTLIKKLAEALHATTLFWDDYDEISSGPKDYVEWYKSSRDYDEWVYAALANTLKKLKEEKKVVCPATKKELVPTKYILLDAPLGYCHKATGQHIDFLICLDTPPDIALARRLLRDHQSHSECKKMKEDLEYYLAYSRPLFILTSEQKKSDLLLNGSLPLEKQEQIVLHALREINRINQ